MTDTRGFFPPCNCVSTCGDTDDEYGVCKRLPCEPKPPLVEVVLVHRDDARESQAEQSQGNTE